MWRQQEQLELTVESNRHAFEELEAICTFKGRHLAEFANTQMFRSPRRLANVKIKTIMLSDSLDGYRSGLVAL